MESEVASVPVRLVERRPIRVLAFVTDFNIGGTERQVVNLARGLEPAGFELHMACFKRAGELFGELDARKVPVEQYRIARLYGPRTLLQQLPLSVRRASPADVDLVLECSDPRRGRDQLLERLARGDWCFLAFDPDGRPVHSDWATLTRARVPELDSDVQAGEAEAYLYDAYTPPRRRGHGAFGYVLDHAFAELRAHGVKVAFSYVRSDDPEGQRSAAKRLRPVGTRYYLRLPGRSPLVLGRRGRGMPTLVASADSVTAPRRRAAPRGWPCRYG